MNELSTLLDQLVSQTDKTAGRIFSDTSNVQFPTTDGPRYFHFLEQTKSTYVMLGRHSIIMICPVSSSSS